VSFGVPENDLEHEHSANSESVIARRDATTPRR
jgi:hypothetical protein